MDINGKFKEVESFDHHCEYNLSANKRVHFDLAISEHYRRIQDLTLQ